MSKRLYWIALAIACIALLAACRQEAMLHAIRSGTLWAAHPLSIAAGMLAGLGIVYTLLASVFTVRFFRRASPVLDAYPALTVVKPLHGVELSLLHNLRSFCEQDYPGSVQFVFGVHDADDPALDVVATLRALYPDADIAVNVDARLYGPNRKMSNILNMLPLAKHDLIVFADSDVSVQPDYLRRVTGELCQPGVGLVTCLFHGIPAGGLWTCLSAKATNYHFLPSIVTGLTTRLAQPCFGQTIALRRTTLERIGGFKQFTHHLAEDHAIGEAVRAIGERVVVPPFAVGHACEEGSAGRLLAHELRWSRTIRTINPGGYVGSILLFPVALSLLAVLFSCAAHWSVALIIGAVLSRFVLKACCDAVLALPRSGRWLMPIWDVVAFVIFLSSFLSSEVIWRGFSYKVGADGLMYPLTEE